MDTLTKPKTDKEITQDAKRAMRIAVAVMQSEGREITQADIGAAVGGTIASEVATPQVQIVGGQLDSVGRINDTVGIKGDVVVRSC